MYHHQLNAAYGLKHSEYVPPIYQRQDVPVYATNPNTINNFHELSQQGNKRVRIKKVYHVVKNKPIDVPSHHEFERRRHDHHGDYCPECNALPTYIPVREAIPAVPYVPPPVVYNMPPPPEAPALPVYTPTQYNVPINRNAASYTPDHAQNHHYNDNPPVSVYSKEFALIFV